MPYELLEHTADAKFRATGATREEAFACAVQAMTAIAADPRTLARDKAFHVTVTSKGLESLLFDLLDEILYLLDTEHFLPAAAEALSIVERDGRLILDATLRGDDSRKYPCNLKAVTYSDMVVGEREGVWVCQAVIDI